MSSRPPGDEQHHLPVNLPFPQHLPDALGQARDDEGREMPDGFLRAELTEAAAGKPASHRERQGNQLAVGNGRKADQQSDMAPAYGPAISPTTNAPSSVRSAAL